MNRIAYAAALTMLVGCGLSEDAFTEQLTEKSCEWAVECFDFYETVDECITAANEDPVDVPDDCTYDAKQAKACVDAVDELTCDDTALPSECDTVYDCPTDTDTSM